MTPDEAFEKWAAETFPGAPSINDSDLDLFKIQLGIEVMQCRLAWKQCLRYVLEEAEKRAMLIKTPGYTGDIIELASLREICGEKHDT